MTVVLWILGILLALLVLLCLTRVGVHALFGDALALDAKIGPFRIHILPGKKQDKKREKRAKEPKEAEKSEEKAEKKPCFPKPSMADIREAVSVLWPPLKRALNRTRRGGRIHPMDLCVTLGGQEDPAAAAQLYGEAHAGVWAVMPVLERLLVIPEPHIHIGIDFNASETKVEGELGVTARVGTLLAVGATVAFPALKWFLRYRKKQKKQPPEPKAATA